MEAQAEQLRAFLDAVRRRAWLREGLAAGLWCLTLLGLTGLLVLLAGESAGESRAWRCGLLALLGLGLILVAVGHGLAPVLRLSGGARLARLVEARLPVPRLSVVTAAELAALGSAGLEARGLSVGLAEAHLGSVVERLAGHAPASLLPPGRLRAPAASALVLGLLCAAGYALSPERFARGVAGLLRGPSEEALAAAAGPDWVGDLEIAYRYPDYTGRPERRVPGADGSILALPGTEVSLRARTDRPVRAGLLRVNEQPLPLEVEAGRELAGRWLVMAAGEYRFELLAEDGPRWRSPRGLPIRLETDRPPEVRLLSPGRDQVVREDETVELVWDARDDFGLGEVRLAWRVVGRPAGEQKKVLVRPGPGARAERRTTRFALAEHALGPGEQVQLYVEAVDRDSVLGPKTGRSSALTLKVFSADEHHRALMAEVQALWERMLARLGDHLEPAAPPGREALGVQRRLLTGLVELREEADRLARALDREAASPGAPARPVAEALTLVRTGLEGLGRELAWLLEAAEARRSDAARATELKLLASHQTRRAERLARDVLYLEDLLDLDRLRQIEGLAAALRQAEQRLTELLEAYRRSPSDEVRRRIEAEIAGLKARMAELLARQAEVIKELRDEYLNPEALARMASEGDALGALDRIQALLQEGRVEEAMAELARLREQLGGLQEAVRQARQSYGEQRYSELAQAVERLQAELGQIAAAQEGLSGETDALRRLSLERLQAELGEGLKSRLAGLEAQARKLAELYRGIPESELAGYLQPVLERLREDAGLLGEALRQSELAQALELSASERLGAEQLAAWLEHEASLGGVGADGPPPGSRAARLQRHQRRATQAAELAAALHEALRRLMPSTDRLLKGDEAGRLRKLEHRQRELRGKLGALRSEMERLNQGAPLFGEDMLGGAEQGGRAMRQAADELGVLDPRAAHPHQQSALQQLERMRAAMEQAAQSCPQGGGGMPLPMGAAGRRSGRDQGSQGDFDRERVEIPGADEFRPPEAFREELLKGMKDPVPEDYQPQVRKYYEELIR